MTRREPGSMKKEKHTSKRKPTGGEDVYERKPLPVIPVMAGIAFAFLLAACAFIGMLFVVNKPFEQVENTTVPDLLGQSYESIKTQYAGQFNIVVEEEGPSSVYEEGEIYDQNPDPGLTVKEQSTISIKVSTGKQTVVLEDYAGRDSTEVFRDLNSKNLKWVETETYSNEYAAGTVVMTAPGAGEEVAEGDEISVYVSLGSQEQNQTVPLIVGMNYHEARTLLTTRRLRIELVEEVQPETDEDGNVIAGQQAAGTILSQSPTEDTQVERSSTSPSWAATDGRTRTSRSRSRFRSICRRAMEWCTSRPLWTEPKPATATRICPDSPPGPPARAAEAMPRWRSISTGSSTRPLM